MVTKALSPLQAFFIIRKSNFEFRFLDNATMEYQYDADIGPVERTEMLNEFT